MTSNAATLTVNPAPVAPSITTQPASQTVTAGQTATFSVTATGTAPLSYQWQKNGAAISGATSSSYTTPAETTVPIMEHSSPWWSPTPGQRDQQRRDPHRQPSSGGTVDHHAASEPDRYRRTDSNLLGDCDRNRAAELSVAEERHGHQRRNFVELHDPGRNDVLTMAHSSPWSSPTRGQRDQQRRDPHRQPSAGGAVDHHAAGEPDGHRRTDSNVLGDRDRNRAARAISGRRTARPSAARHRRATPPRRQRLLIMAHSSPWWSPTPRAT